MNEFIELGEEEKIALKRTAKASKVYGVLLLISVGTTLCTNIISIVINGYPAFSLLSSVIGMSITVAFGLFLIFFSKYSKDYIRTNRSSALQKAFGHLKKFFTLRGALYLAVIGLTFLAFFIALLIGASRTF